MSDGPRRGPSAIANDLAIAAKNAAAKAAAGRREERRKRRCGWARRRLYVPAFPERYGAAPLVSEPRPTNRVRGRDFSSGFG
jgi:hypothetical protein